MKKSTKHFRIIVSSIVSLLLILGCAQLSVVVKVDARLNNTNKVNALGDFDGDGEITVVDALGALRIAALLAPETPEAIAVCDVDNDGTISVNDALLILRVAAGLAKPFGTYFTVTFVDWDGTVIEAKKVIEGGDAVPPADPTREGYVFSGWDGSYTNVTADTTVTAAYTLASSEGYLVTFYGADGSSVIKQQSVLTGGSATPPEAPSKPGADFVGWSGNYVNVVKDEAVRAVFSDEKNVFVVESKSGSVGNTVHVLVSIDGTVKTCGFALSISYDSNLELVSFDDDLDLDILANHIPDNNAIKLNFTSNYDKTKQRDIIELVFRIKSSSKTRMPVTISVNSITEIVDGRTAHSTCSIVDGVITIA